MKAKKLFIYLFLSSVIFNIEAQEIFFTGDGKLKTIQPNHLYLTAANDNSDYITNDQRNALVISGSKTTVLSRFFENTTLSFQTTGYIQIPNNVIKEVATSQSKGLTISGWLRINDISQNTNIGFASTSQSEGVKFDISLINKKVVIRKKSRLKNNTLSPIIITDFPVDFDGIAPTIGDITNGFFYFSISSDDKKSRITISRPGGRLYTRLYYVSLTDVLTLNDSFYWGKSPLSTSNNIPDAFDDLMVYNKYLTPEDELNTFYLQSPLYPGVSYLFNSPDGFSAAPQNHNNDTQEFNMDYFMWFKLNYTGAYSCNKWFIKLGAKDKPSSDTKIYFANARSGGNIYQQTSSNYLYQLQEPSSLYPNRTQYIEKRNVTPMSLYSPNPTISPGLKIGTYWFNSIQSSGFSLGWNGDYMYLLNPTAQQSWSVAGAQKVYDRNAGAKISINASSNMYVMIKNYQLGKYLDLYWGGAYNYLVLNDRDDNNKNQRFLLETKSKTDYDIYRKVEIKTSSNVGVSPYWGERDQSENEYIIAYGHACTWEFVYVKDDENNKPLYAIRANNDWGSYLLGYKNMMGTNPYYICQASTGAYTPDGDVNDNFLWSIDVISGSVSRLNENEEVDINTKAATQEKISIPAKYRMVSNAEGELYNLSCNEEMLDVTAYIYNMQGVCVASKRIIKSYSACFDLSSCPSGVYLLNIHSEKDKQTIKFIKR